MKYIDAYTKLDNTLCLNSPELSFGLDTEEHEDCVDAYDMVTQLETLKCGAEKLDRIEAIEAHQYISFETLWKIRNQEYIYVDGEKYPVVSVNLEPRTQTYVVYRDSDGTERCAFAGDYREGWWD